MARKISKSPLPRSELVRLILDVILRSSDSKWDRVQLECIKCLKAIMNNKVGLQNLFDHKEALTLLARSITPTVPLVMLEAVKLMAAVCLVPPDGHDKVRVFFFLEYFFLLFVYF